MHYLFRSNAPLKALVFLSVDATAGDLQLGPALSATKFGMVGLQRSLVATAPPDIRVCTVAAGVPGGTMLLCMQFDKELTACLPQTRRTYRFCA